MAEHRRKFAGLNAVIKQLKQEVAEKDIGKHSVYGTGMAFCEPLHSRIVARFMCCFTF